MAMLENVALTCAMYGDASVFEVTIARDAKVSELQKRIFERKGYVTKPGMDTSVLTLYLAQKDDRQWLTDDEKLDALLLGDDGDPSRFTKMRTTWRLNKPELFGSNFTPGEEEIHVLVKLPTPSVDPEPKRQKVPTAIVALWNRSKWPVEKLLALQELAQRLHQPLPFQLELLDATVASEVFTPDSPLLQCGRLTTLMGSYICWCTSLLPKEDESWRSFYGALLLIPDKMCNAKGLQVHQHRTSSDDGIVVRPDYILQHKGLVVMRGDENTALVSKTSALQQFQAKMRRWSDKLYGDLPYILGYVTCGDDLHLFAIAKPTNGTSVGPCRYTTIAELNIVEHKATALKLFYNLAFLIYEMASTASRDGLDFHACGLKPFVPDVGENRTIVLLDGVIERTIHESKSNGSLNFQRLVDIYKTLEDLSAKDTATTHLQTVEQWRVLTLDDDKSLVVTLSPIGYKRFPTVQEVVAFLRHMLTALALWHGRQFCHGDVCWRNIVFVEPNTSKMDGYWMLRPDTTEIYWNHPFQGHTLRFQHDLYQLGLLVDNLPFKLPNAVKAMQTILLSAVDLLLPEMTAEMALAKLAKLTKDVE